MHTFLHAGMQVHGGTPTSRGRPGARAGIMGSDESGWIVVVGWDGMPGDDNRI